LDFFAVTLKICLHLSRFPKVMVATRARIPADAKRQRIDALAIPAHKDLLHRQEFVPPFSHSRHPFLGPTGLFGRHTAMIPPQHIKDNRSQPENRQRETHQDFNSLFHVAFLFLRASIPRLARLTDRFRLFQNEAVTIISIKPSPPFLCWGG
jgi:hypothetical protein